MTLTPEQVALQAHLNKIEADTRAWVAADPNTRWACYPVTDIAHWAEQGINSVAAFVHYNLVAQVFESTRDLHGYKPNWSALMALTDAELQAESDALSAEYQRQADEEARGKAKEAAALAPQQHGWAIGDFFPR